MDAVLRGAMQLAERPLERLDFALVINLLAFCQLECFKNLFHLGNGCLELLDNGGDLFDCLADSRPSRCGLDRRWYRLGGWGWGLSFVCRIGRRRLFCIGLRSTRGSAPTSAS